MKNIIWVLVILVVLVLGFVFLGGEKTEEILTPAEPVDNELTIPAGASLIDAEASSLKWTGRKTLIATWVDTGVIDLKGGYVVYENGIPVRGEALIDMTTIRASNTGRGGEEENVTKLTQHLSSDDFFNVELYPTSRIVAESITPVEGKANTYKVSGDLTIRGITHPIEFELAETAPKKFHGIATVDRSIYDVKFGSGKFFSDLGDNIIDDMFTLEMDLVVQ